MICDLDINMFIRQKVTERLKTTEKVFQKLKSVK